MSDKVKIISVEGNKITNLDVKLGCDVDNLDPMEMDSEDEDDEKTNEKNRQLKDVKIE